ncbi:PREDICTED: uncharacterized protein LOC105462026 [Wasmannia auropunctata]|uniref:uncharacterized protein LOC105462026 n=1 Tax=Wasmannia auropunctata TaxID=64793 RepID=UPI0005ED8963|nr:PREDICTED: uncharacterized protein LOC105462026 [Wasmannia auropunctata]
MRPGARADEDLEIVSVQAGTGPRRGSTSSSSGKIRPPPRIGQKRKKILSSPETDKEEVSPISSFSDSQRKELAHKLQDIELLSSADMAAVAMEWLNDMEECRKMSSNMKGSITRKMKINVAALAETTKILSMRASQEGDVGFLRSKLTDMQSEINGLREENQRLKVQMDEIASGLRIRASPPGNSDPRPGTSSARMEISPDPPPGLETNRSREASVQLQSENVGRRTNSRETSRPRERPSGTMDEEFLDRLGNIINGAVASAIWAQLPGSRRTGRNRREETRNPPAREVPQEGEGWGSSSVAVDSQAAETGDEIPLPQRRESARGQKNQTRRTRGNTLRDPAGNTAGLVNRPAYQADYPPLPEREDRREIPRLVRDAQVPRQEEKTRREVNRGQENRRVARTPRVRAPRSSAITISCPEGITYSEVIRKARNEIALDELGIKETRMRSTMGGSVLIEIPGDNTSPAANNLAKKLQEAFKDTNVQIRRPMMRGEVRLAGLDASVTTEELIEAVARAGGCEAANVRLGSFRLARNGMRTVWLQCPLEAATRLAETGKIRAGWSTALVALLKRRPLQCFKCFATGHVRDNCPSEIDRANNCFNCGEPGHTMRECGGPPRCPLCKEKGLRYDHRAGSEVCPPCPPRRTQSGSPRRGKVQANRSNVAEEQRTK